MKPNTAPDYTEVELALNQTKLKLHPSELHGIICGILCGNTQDKVAWEELVTGGDKTAVTASLQLLYDDARQQLKDFLFEIQLLLPESDAPLAARAEALTLWCQGFLTGLKLANVPLSGREASDVTEAINDFVEIAKMNYEDVVDSEEDEAAYTELVEFVRMALILIYQDLHDDDKPVTESSIHLH